VTLVRRTTVGSIPVCPDKPAINSILYCHEKWKRLQISFVPVAGPCLPHMSRAAPTLSPAEKPIVASVDANEQASNARLEKLSGIVDDNEVSRYILRDLLNQPWRDLREAGPESEAMKLLNDSLADAVIVDLLMPDMSGCEILRELRARPATERLPVLIYTSKVVFDAEEVQLESLQARIIRKQDVTTRLSAQPFLDWVKSVGLAPEIVARKQGA
jgi:CheY-like chemotaxis protein